MNNYYILAMDYIDCCFETIKIISLFKLDVYIQDAFWYCDNINNNKREDIFQTLKNIIPEKLLIMQMSNENICLKITANEFVILNKTLEDIVRPGLSNDFYKIKDTIKSRNSSSFRAKIYE